MAMQDVACHQTNDRFIGIDQNRARFEDKVHARQNEAENKNHEPNLSPTELSVVLKDWIPFSQQ